MNDTFIVEVDGLGFVGGCARKGETVTREQIGTENVDRLLLQAAISRTIWVNETVTPVATTPETTPEPEKAAARIAVGLVCDFELSEDELAWVADVKAGVIPIPFDRDKVEGLTVKEIIARIEGLGGTPPAKAKPSKADAVDALEAAIGEVFTAWEVAEIDDDEA